MTYPCHFCGAERTKPLKQRWMMVNGEKTPVCRDCKTQRHKNGHTGRPPMSELRRNRV